MSEKPAVVARSGWGGVRRGAGRPGGSGKYRVATRAIRIPAHLCDRVQACVADGMFSLPLYSSTVHAGFPSPADDFIEKRVDVDDLVVRRPHATFLLKVSGHSMSEAGILDGDFLVVDKSLQPRTGDVVVAAVDGEFAVKRYIKRSGRIVLAAEHPDYAEIVVGADSDVTVWGVVSGVVRQLTRR